jgi:hypothetical protein
LVPLFHLNSFAMSAPAYTYLALGDSYTIGEGAPAADSFPWQTVRLLREAGIPFSDPQIVAKTGWTTGELMEGIAARFPEPFQRIPSDVPTPSSTHQEIVAGEEASLRGGAGTIKALAGEPELASRQVNPEALKVLTEVPEPGSRQVNPEPSQPVYDFVSLLIGVNNEYRGRSLAEYAAEFGQLLRQAIRFAGGFAAHVFVLSIPDWSVTPFAQASLPDKLGRDKAMIAGEIDAFNEVASRIAGQYQVGFIDITSHTRESGKEAERIESALAAQGQSGALRIDESWLAADLLHPSGREYGYWAELLASRIGERIGA